jgi:hypothetical protein
MKYILMMNTMKAGQGIPQWPGKDLQVHIAFMKNLNKELRDSGELVSAEGLSFPDQVCLVRAGKNCAPITDGVFPESKEFLAGFWIVDSPERAYTIAARASAAPGRVGAPLNMQARQIEVFRRDLPLPAKFSGKSLLSPVVLPFPPPSCSSFISPKQVRSAREYND